jgi:hypothetical protein
MNLSEYQLLSLIYIPYSLILFALDFLSDKNITKNELKIGILQYIHHLFGIFNIGVIILFLTSKSLVLTAVSIIINLIAQVGFLINGDYCWLLTLVNKQINPEMPNRKWRGEIVSLIKHYLRGDEWAYSDIRNNDATPTVLFVNIFMFFQLMKLLL